MIIIYSYSKENKGECGENDEMIQRKGEHYYKQEKILKLPNWIYIVISKYTGLRHYMQVNTFFLDHYKLILLHIFHCS